MLGPNRPHFFEEEDQDSYENKSSESIFLGAIEAESITRIIGNQTIYLGNQLVQMKFLKKLEP